MTKAVKINWTLAHFDDITIFFRICIQFITTKYYLYYQTFQPYNHLSFGIQNISANVLRHEPLNNYYFLLYFTYRIMGVIFLRQKQLIKSVSSLVKKCKHLTLLNLLLQIHELFAKMRIMSVLLCVKGFSPVDI